MTHKSIIHAPVIAGIAAFLTVAATLPVIAADEVESFYKRKRVTIYVGYSPGGGYDQYARMLARHMGQFIPGKPRIIVKNRPGAGSLVLTNEMKASQPKDGTVIATIGRGVVLEPLFGNRQAQFDPLEFGWIGSMNNEVSVCAAWHTAPVKTFADLQTRGMIVGGTARGSDTDSYPTMLNNLLGTRMKLVSGYPGGNDINFAVEKGELEGRCGWSWASVISTRPNWQKEKKIVVLAQLSTAKHPDLPDVPLVTEFATDEKQKQIMALVFNSQIWGRPFFTTSGVPANRVAALRSAFMQTLKDPKFLAEAQRSKQEINPVSGEDVEKAVREVYTTPKEIALAAKEATENTAKIEISKARIENLAVTARIDALEKGGREILFSANGKAHKAAISGSRTAVLVGGKEAKRSALKVGMTCAFEVVGVEARKIACQ